MPLALPFSKFAPEQRDLASLLLRGITPLYTKTTIKANEISHKIILTKPKIISQLMPKAKILIKFNIGFGKVIVPWKMI